MSVFGNAIVSGDLTVTGNIYGTGPKGPCGPNGATGATGTKGPCGPSGNSNPTTGAKGPCGPQGYTGATGARGACGPQGYTGATGARGPCGPQGNTGATGLRGDDGPRGATGAVVLYNVHSSAIKTITGTSVNVTVPSGSVEGNITVVLNKTATAAVAKYKRIGEDSMDTNADVPAFKSRIFVIGKVDGTYYQVPSS